MQYCGAARARLDKDRPHRRSDQRTRHWKHTAISVAVALALARAASAQSPGAEPPTGGNEAGRVEVAVGVWNATPQVVVSSGTLGIAGSGVDLVGDLGLFRKRLAQLRLVFRVAPRHKVRVGYVPTRYEVERMLTRTVEFGRMSFATGIPVAAGLTFDTWRFGYEYDGLSSDRGFLGVIGEVRYVRVGATLNSRLLRLEVSSVDWLVPTVGGTGRIYVHPRVAASGEVTWFHVPGVLEDGHGSGNIVDFDVSGLAILTRNIGLQAGYRTLDVNYQLHENAGSLALSGIYVNAVIRF